MFDLLGPLMIGFVGSLHCLGMCGPLIMAYSLHLRTAGGGDIAAGSFWREGTHHHLVFHLGRFLTYGFLGALGAGLFHLAGFQQWFSGLRSGLSLGGGVTMMIFGLVLLKVLPFPLSSLAASPGSGKFFGRVFPFLLRSRKLESKLALGLATGTLPCMLSWAMIVKAATTQDPVQGFLTMAAFGLGTFPALFFTGLFASLFSLKTRIVSERIAAAAVIFMGFILIFKGARNFG